MSDQRGFSRRRFLQGVGAGALAAGAMPDLARGAEAPEEAADLLGPGPVPVTLDVNGVETTIEVEPRVTLLDALRSRMDVTGAKKVCDHAACGACTVLLDGQPVYACSILAVAAQGRKIETVEGLAPGGELTPVQQAFVAHDALQCGFCTSGFVLASEALLRKNPRPSAEEVQEALSGNLCRCGSYQGIKQAASGAAPEGG